MAKTLLILMLTFMLLDTNSCTQKDLIKNGSNLYQDFKKNLKINDAYFILILKGDKVLIDTLTLKKIDPNWLEKIDILKTDPNSKIRNDSIPTILIYIRHNYIKNTEKVINTNKK